METAIDYREMNLQCMKYLTGQLPLETELQLKQQLKTDSQYKAWFNWLLLKWLKTRWLKRRMSTLKASKA